jgi:hypothetical protein
MSNGQIAKLLQEILIRQDNIERLLIGQDAPLKPGDPAIRIAARELMRGNKEPMKALGGRKMAS